jgi:hypothetical protein
MWNALDTFVRHCERHLGQRLGQLLGGGLPQSIAQDLVCVPAGGAGQRGPAVVQVGAAQRLVSGPGRNCSIYCCGCALRDGLGCDQSAGQAVQARRSAEAIVGSSR